MDQEYNFSGFAYEHVKHEPALPFRTFFTSVGFRGFHWHREIELILVLEGEVTLTKPDARFGLAAGDLLLLNPYEPHSLIKGGGGNTLLALQIDPSGLAGAGADAAGLRFRCEPGMDGRDAGIAAVRSSMARIVRELAAQEPGSAFACLEEVYGILKTLRRAFPGEEPAGGSEDGQRKNLERLRRILDYMHDNSADPLRLAEVAASVNLSSFYVSHLIKENTGLSFQQNLNALRMQRAIRLMLATEKRLIDIALDVGFSDIKYLNKCFKDFFGLRPSELRGPQERADYIRSRLHSRVLEEAELMGLLAGY